MTTDKRTEFNVPESVEKIMETFWGKMRDQALEITTVYNFDICMCNYIEKYLDNNSDPFDEDVVNTFSYAELVLSTFADYYDSDSFSGRFSIINFDQFMIQYNNEKKRKFLVLLLENNLRIAFEIDYDLTEFKFNCNQSEFESAIQVFTYLHDRYSKYGRNSSEGVIIETNFDRIIDPFRSFNLTINNALHLSVMEEEEVNNNIPDTTNLYMVNFTHSIFCLDDPQNQLSNMIEFSDYVCGSKAPRSPIDLCDDASPMVSAFVYMSIAFKHVMIVCAQTIIEMLMMFCVMIYMRKTACYLLDKHDNLEEKKDFYFPSEKTTKRRKYLKVVGDVRVMKDLSTWPLKNKT